MPDCLAHPKSSGCFRQEILETFDRFGTRAITIARLRIPYNVRDVDSHSHVEASTWDWALAALSAGRDAACNAAALGACRTPPPDISKP